MQNKNFKDHSNQSNTDSKSQKIHEEIKHKVFKKIFDLLDTRDKNKIYGNTIDISVLPDNIKRIIEPLILELRDQNETLTGEEFVLACEHLFKVMQLRDKNQLFEFYFDKESKTNLKKTKRNESFTFKVC